MASPSCPRCDGRMQKKYGAKGRFWGCVRYPDCTGTREFGEAATADSPGTAEDLAENYPVRLDSVQLSEVLTELRSISQAVAASTDLNWQIGELKAELATTNRLLSIFAMNKIDEWERRRSREMEWIGGRSDESEGTGEGDGR